MSNTTTKSIRVATVKATGRRYVVQQMSFGKTDADHRVHTWGEVLSFTPSRATGLICGTTKYDGTKKFAMNAVTVEEVAPTVVLFNALFEQMKDVRRAAGHTIVGNTDYGTEEQRAIRREAGKALVRELQSDEIGRAVLRAVNRTLW